MKKMWRASKALGSMVYGTIVGDPTTVVAAASSSLLGTEKESQAERKSTKTYDVFLSFSGADTRSAFTGHLYAALSNAGIITFIDDEELRRGDDISLALLTAIEGSRICVIVFSRNYGNSRWCLLELEKILEFQKTIGLTVIPIFYGVEPTDVRNQTGNFGKAFKKPEGRLASKEKYKVLNWRKALREAANLSGWELNGGTRHEAKIINGIVIDISRRLDSTYLFVVEHPVGIKSRVQDIIQLLNVGLADVRLIGVLGMGGSGKTTVAKAIYNEIHHEFEGRSFLANVREVWGQENGKVSLQEQLVYDVFPTNKMRIRSVDWGTVILKERLHQKKVFLVLDDIDRLEQLNALTGNRNWFGPGSRIIITTRDEHLLNVLNVDEVYMMKEMDVTESLELFSWHAFKEKNLKEDFIELSGNVVAYSGGLPLALEVLGSYLFDRDIPQWESTLEKLKRIPNDQVQKKLKISFDGLSDDEIKDIFLDISCFFIGVNRNDVVKILDGCGFYAEIGISVLMERCLITVDKKNKLTMHDLLRDMGREIVREKSARAPEERSRLWFHEDVLDVLTKHTGTKVIEGISLTVPRLDKVSFNSKAFKDMKRLRLLQLGHVKLIGEYKYLSKDLRWLCWHKFPLGSIPEDFYLGCLVAMDLRYSNLKQFWKAPQLTKKLKLLNLSHSSYLTHTPDFSYLPNLEKLILKYCPRLSMVHESIGDLSSLVLVNFRDCKSLCNLPRSFYKLKSLRTLILSGCSKIERLEEDLDQMESLTTLIAANTNISQVPFSIINSKSIRYLSLCGYQGPSRDVFPSLIWSWMSPRDAPQSLTSSFGCLSSLVSLNLRNEYFLSLPSTTLSGLPMFGKLWMQCGLKLRPARHLARNFNALSTLNRKMLKKTSEIPKAVIQGSNNLLNSLMIHMGGYNKITATLSHSILQEWSASGFGDLVFHTNDYFDWFIYEDEGPSVYFELPQIVEGSLKGITACVAYSSSVDKIPSKYLVCVINHTKGTIQILNPRKVKVLTSQEDQQWQGMISNIDGGDGVEVIVDFGFHFTVTKTSIFLAFGKSTDLKIMEHQGCSLEGATSSDC